MELSPKPTYVTSPDGAGLHEVYRELNKTITEMDSKVSHVIKKHENEFLFAYQAHIAKIKKELAEIKHKSQEQEKLFSSNDRIQYLEKETINLRKEALRLYNVLEQKSQESEAANKKLKELDKLYQSKEKELKEYMRTAKTDRIQLQIMQDKITQLEQVITHKENQIDKISVNRGEVKVISQSTPLRIAKPTKRVYIYDTADHQLKDYFLDCIRTIKREIAQRNNTAQLHLDLQAIKSMEEFKMVDKLKLLELFISNEKLLTTMYEKVFPDRMNQLRGILTSRDEPSKDESGGKTERYDALPKVKNRVRNLVSIQQGKLNISFQ